MLFYLHVIDWCDHVRKSHEEEEAQKRLLDAAHIFKESSHTSKEASTCVSDSSSPPASSSPRAST